MEREILKVSSKSVPTSVAGAIAAVVKEHGSTELQIVGAGAANQAIKSIAVARKYLEEAGIDLVCIPEFTQVMIQNEKRTAIRLMVEAR